MAAIARAKARPSEVRVRAALDRIGEAGRRARDGDPEGADGLLTALAAGDSSLYREAAARWVARVAEARDLWPGAAAPVPALLEAMASAARGGAAADPGCRVRLEAVAALGHLRAPAALAEPALRVAVQTVQIEPVGAGLEDTAVSLRAAAAVVMAERGCDCLADLAFLLFDGVPDPVSHLDPNLAARLGAVRALTALPDPAAVAVLALRLRDEREAGDVRAACVDALLALACPRAAEWVRPLLDARDPVAAVAAAAALCRLEPGPTVPRVLGRIAGAGPDLAAALTLTLAAARTPEAREALAALRADRRPSVRRAAGEALVGDEGPRTGAPG